MTALRERLPNRRGIDSISIGQRHRKDLGDINGFAASIASIGLLQPVVITPEGILIAGERRLAACRLLGWPDVPVHVVDIDAIARGELAENVHRKDFTPSEMVAIAATVEDRERELARHRMGEGGKVGKLSTPSDAGKTRDKVAAPLGISGKTLQRAQAVVAAAKADPESFGKLQEDMDRTGRVNGVYRRLKIAKQAEQIRAESPPLPGRGPYRVIVIDVPWPYEIPDEDPSHRGARPYLTMTLEAICTFGSQVQKILHPDCILWFWTTNHHMRQAFAVLDAWGFEQNEQKTILTWAKDKMGLGDWLRGQTEHGGARQADRHAHESNNAAARAGARAFTEAGRVLRPRPIALPGTAILRPVQPLPA
jgi:hypothetical protein